MTFKDDMPLGLATDRIHSPSGFRWMVCMALALTVLLAGCDGSGGSGGTVFGPNVQLSGRVTYDSVPVAASVTPYVAYLDYAETVARPARGVQVAAIDDDGRELALGAADADGRYVLTVPKNTPVRLRAVARLYQAPGDGASWDFTIRDNTSPGYADKAASIYAVQGEAFNTGVAHLSRDLHAASGWTGAGYGNPRSAAPFAILDQIFTGMQKVLAVDQDAVFAPMNTYWSIHNRSANGDKAKGEIGTSHWQPGTDHPGLYILGKEDSDTDEYDTAVVVHEWGHYFEAKFSRSDSVGGSHGNEENLDMRVSFGEGWGNALAGMVRDDPIYADTQGPRQAHAGVVADLDTIPVGETRGWFNEASVQHVLYQMYKAPSIGFGAIYAAMVGPQKDTPALTSLFSFATYLRGVVDGAGQGLIDTLLGDIDTVNGDDLDIWGTNQTYPAFLDAGGKHFVVPVYRDFPLATDETICGTYVLGKDYNKLGRFQFRRVTIDVAGDYTLTFYPDPDAPAPPDLEEDELAGLNLSSRGVSQVELEFEGPRAGGYGGTVDVSLDAGVYTMAVVDQRNNGTPYCQTVTLTKKP